VRSKTQLVRYTVRGSRSSRISGDDEMDGAMLIFGDEESLEELDSSSDVVTLFIEDEGESESTQDSFALAMKTVDFGQVELSRSSSSSPEVPYNDHENASISSTSASSSCVATAAEPSSSTASVVIGTGEVFAAPDLSSMSSNSSDAVPEGTRVEEVSSDNVSECTEEVAEVISSEGSSESSRVHQQPIEQSELHSSDLSVEDEGFEPLRDEAAFIEVESGVPSGRGVSEDSSEEEFESLPQERRSPPLVIGVTYVMEEEPSTPIPRRRIVSGLSDPIVERSSHATQQELERLTRATLHESVLRQPSKQSWDGSMGLL
jgi:hypothetical protein